MKLSKLNPLLLAATSLASFILSLAAPSAYGATETFNTPGTFNWVCPPGITAIQVECWGGGGAGGAGTKVNNTGTNTIQNGGGGGGGGYARASVPVTPGEPYTITIPPAAVSGTNGLLAANIVSGATVTFTGDGGITVSAAGGTGGRNAYVTGANAPAAGAGGAGGTGITGDAVYSGGAGAAGTTGGGNVSGGGGGGAGDASNGGAGQGVNNIGAAGGSGGIAGGGAGGNGVTGGTVFATRAPGSPGSTPGGGGGGGHNIGQSTHLGGTGGSGQIIISYEAPAIVKADNVHDLNLSTSWVGGEVPASFSRAQWDNTVTSANTTSLGGDLTFAGIVIADPAGPVTINAGNTLTLGGANLALDLSGATQDLILNSDLALGAPNVWQVASGRTATLGGVVSGVATVAKQGDGTVVLSGSNTYTGTTTVSAGTLSLGHPTDTLLDTAAVSVSGGTLDLGANSDTVGAVTLVSGSITGTTGVLTGSSYAVQSGGISAILGGAGALTKTTSGTATLSGANTYADLTTVSAGLLVADHNSALGSTVGETTVASTASLQLGSGVTITGETVTIAGNGAASLGALRSGNGASQWAGTVILSGAAPRLGALADTSLSVSGDIQGSQGLGISGEFGTGTVIVSAPAGTNTYTGPTNIIRGVLKIGATDSLPTDTTLDVASTTAADDSTFDLNGFDQTIGVLQRGGTGTGGSFVTNSGAGVNTLTVDQTVNTTFSGLLQGNLALNKANTGTLTLTGANSHTGLTTLSGGMLMVNGSLGSGPVSVNSGTTLGGTGMLGGTVTVANGTAAIMGGNGTSGTLSIQNLTFSGTGFIDVGPLANYLSNPAIDTTGTLTLNGGAGAVTINLDTAAVPSGAYPLVKAANGIANASGFTLGTAPALIGRQTPGTLQYDSINNLVTYTTGGTYPIWSGAQSSEWSTNFIFPAKNWLLAGGGGPTDFLAGDEVMFDDSATNRTVDISNGDVAPAYVRFTNTTGNDYTLQGSNGLTGSAALLKSGSGKLTITNANSHTGGTTLSNGILAFGAGALGTSGPITVNGATLQWNDTNTEDISSQLTLVNAATATLDTNGNNVTLATAFGGNTSAALTKVGDGTLTLSSANTYTGPSTISGGTLKIGNAASLGAGTGIADGTTISPGATLDLGGVSNGINASSGTERLTVSGSGIGGNGAITSSTPIPTPFIGVRFLTLAADTTLGFANRWDVGSNNATVSSALVGGGYTLNVLGTAAGAQASFNWLGETDLGDININLGGTAATNIMYLQGSTNLGRPGNTVTITGGSTLDFFTNSTIATVDKKFALDNGLLRISRTGATALAGTISLAGSNTITANAAAVAITASNVISGDGNLTKAGAGTLALAVENNYTGATTVSTGGLVAGANNALGTAAGSTTVVTGAALGFAGGINYSTAETVIGSGAGNGAALGVFAVGSRGFFQSVSGNNTFAGAVQFNATGTSRIGAQDGASLTLTGPITMFDTTTGVTVLFRVGNLDGDFVTLTNPGNSWDTQTQVFSNNAGAGAGVRLGVANALPTTAALAGFTGAGTGTTLDLAGFSQEVAGLSNTGANANLRITNSVDSATSILTLNNTANLDSGANVVIADGAGVVAVVKTGNFTQTLAAANTYTGTTTVAEGTLALVGGSQTSALTVAAGASLGFTLGSPTTSTATVDLTTGTVKITGMPALPGYTLMTASGGFIGTPVLDAPISGYVLEVDGNNLELNAVTDPYLIWSGGAAFDVDSNGDGVNNGLAWLLGAPDKDANALGLLPKVTQSGGNLTMNFSMLNAASRGGAALKLQHSSDLGSGDPWTEVTVPETSGGPTSGVTFIVTPGSPLNTVTATIADSEADDGRLFGRLSASAN